MLKRFVIELFAPIRKIDWILFLFCFVVGVVYTATIVGTVWLLINYEVLKVIFFGVFFAWVASRVVAYVIFAWRRAKNA